MAVKYNSQYNDDGTSMGQDASEKVGFHGSAVAQASNITTQATIPTTLTDGTIALRFNSLAGKVNSLLTACRNKGIIASS